MPFSTTYNRILERCGLANSGITYQTRVTQLADELASALRPMIQPDIYNNTDYTFTLSAALWNLTAAEFLGCLRRETGASETVTVGDLKIEPGPDDSQTLREEGWKMLAPFLQPDFLPLATRVLTGRRNPTNHQE